MKEGEELLKLKDKLLALEGTIGHEPDSVVLVGPFLLRVFYNSLLRNVGFRLRLGLAF